MWSRGIVTIMHLDTDWKKNLSYFKRDLKRGSYMLQMDNMTDMFAAKEYLQNHAMFHGDLPATMQAIGSVEDVQGYCKKLIDEVGYEGGFVLGTGCETAPNFKLENLRAMVETGKTYEFSKR
jgi:uroporphyrinogen-III decarboxylase